MSRLRTHIIFNQRTPAEILREQRAIIRTLRKNHPDGEQRIALTDGTTAKYDQMDNTVNLYVLPCDEFQCNIDLLSPDLIDPQATRALWQKPPPEYEAPPAHWHSPKDDP